MDKKSLKKAIFLNIAVLTMTVVLLVGVSFAWFTMEKESQHGQSVQIGSFVVVLDEDTASFTAASNIDVTNAFPMTRAYAIEKSADLKNAYKFQVRNDGTVSAKFRFQEGTIKYFTVAADGTETVSAEVQALLKAHLRFDARVSAKGSAIAGAWPAGAGYPTLQAALDAVAPQSDADSLKLTGKATPAAVAEYYDFEILFWLDSALPWDEKLANAKVTFTLTLQAMQSEGGAMWSEFSVPTPTPSPVSA